MYHVHCNYPTQHVLHLELNFFFFEVNCCHLIWSLNSMDFRIYFWVLFPPTFSTILCFLMTEVANHINSRTQIDLILTWKHLCSSMPDQFSKPVHVTIWQISVLPRGRRLHPMGMAIHQICVATESNKSLNCNPSSNRFIINC